MSEARGRNCIFEQPMKPTLSELNFRDLLNLIEEQMATVSCSLLQLHEQHQIELTQAVCQTEKEVLKNSRKIRRTRKNISQYSQFSEACRSSHSVHSESEGRNDSCTVVDVHVEEIAPCNIVHFDEAVPHNSVCDQSTTHVTSVSSNIMTVPCSSGAETQSSGAPVDVNRSDETCCATLSFVVSGRSQVMSKPTFNLLPYWEGNLDATSPRMHFQLSLA